MKTASLSQLTVEDLVQQFMDIGLEQDRAIKDDNTRKYNALFDRMVAVVDELRARPGDQGRALATLLDHPNLQVRLNAAKVTLAVEPDAARRALEGIRATQWQPQAGDAGMSLWNLDRGFKPR
jgi:hypothetical protein